MNLRLMKIPNHEIWYLNKNWKLKNQICCSLFISLAITIGFVVLSLHLNQQFIKYYLQASSKELIKHETESQFKSIQLFKNDIELLLEGTMQQLDVINKIQNFVNQASDFEIEQPFDCLSDKNQVDSFSQTANLCYGIFNGTKQSQNEKQIDVFINSTALLSESLMFGILQETQIGVCHYLPQEYFTMTQSVQIPSQFHPQLRPWYVEHLLSNQKYVQGTPLQAFQGDIKVIMTTNLTVNQTFRGVIAKEVYFNKQVKQIQLNNVTLYLINDDGLVIYNQLYSQQKQSLFYIYQQEITGFNQSDWKEIQNLMNGDIFQSTCETNDYVPSGMICRHNKRNMECTIISVIQIINSPYKLIISKSIDQIIEDEKLLFNWIEEKEQQISMNYMMLNLATISILLILIYLFTIMVMQQTKLLIQYTSGFMHRKSLKILQKQIKSKFNHNLIQSTTLNNLLQSIEKLINIRFKFGKSKICKQIENLKYHLITEEQQLFRNQDIIDSLDQIQVQHQINIQDQAQNQEQCYQLINLLNVQYRFQDIKPIKKKKRSYMN